MIGGQALIEGIYMRGPEKQAIVVRSKDGLVTKVDPVRTNKDRNPIFGWPLIRGVVGFVSERLLDAWLTTNNISFEELSIVYMEHQNWLHKGAAFLKRKFFPKKDA